MSITTDPVCGMKVDSESGRSLEHAGKRYYFCSQHCVEKFSANPDKYLNPVTSAPATTAPSAPILSAGGYTCQMHPEVVSDKLGKCHKCGMALKKVEGKVDAQSDKIGDMAAQCQQLADEFVALQDHFELIMKITDVDELAPAMIKHGEMMAQFSKHLEKHLEMCRQMTSGTSDQRPDDTENSNHKH